MKERNAKFDMKTS